MYHQSYYKLNGIDLSGHKNTSVPQQINFLWRLEDDEGAIMLFVAEKKQKTILNISLDSLIVTEWY